MCSRKIFFDPPYIIYLIYGSYKKKNFSIYIFNFGIWRLVYIMVTVKFSKNYFCLYIYILFLYFNSLSTICLILIIRRWRKKINYACIYIFNKYIFKHIAEKSCRSNAIVGEVFILFIFFYMFFFALEYNFVIKFYLLFLFVLLNQTICYWFDRVQTS